MHPIYPCIWFNNQAEEAAEFYMSTFGNGKMLHTAKYDAEAAKVSGQAEGSVMTVDFELHGLRFTALNGGPLFKINPSISFFVNFDPSVDPNAKENLDKAWAKLIDGGEALMPLDTYPFSKRYGWVVDKFGVSWQLILTNPEGEPRPVIIPSMMFTGDRTGKAEEAIDFYVSVFKDSKKGMVAPYPPGAAPEKSAKIMFAEFMLENQWFTAMDSGHMHKFGFNEAVSFVVSCDTQEEIDAYWNALSAHPENEQCGWLKDKYGVSWQIVPSAMDKMMTGDPKKLKAAMAAMLQMKKLDLAQLQAAYDQA